MSMASLGLFFASILAVANSKLKVYPNPMLDYCTIVAPKYGLYQLHLYDLAGKVVFSQNKVFGTQLREYAVRISKERYEIRKDVFSKGFNEFSEIPKYNRPSKHP